MEKILVEGGNRLEGEVLISGMKNSALPIIFACLLVPHECVIENIPRVSDVYNALEILNSMGAKAYFCGANTVLIDTQNATPYVKRQDLISKMRASSYLMGAMLSRFGQACISLPGGCNFGARPLDLHFKGFCELGVLVEENEDFILLKSAKKSNSAKITLDKISVGATINMVLASFMLNGTTVINNCAQEPHIDDLISFLNLCGARVSRLGSTIVCGGNANLSGITYKIFPDMIEALTYASCVGICGGDIFLKSLVPEHLTYAINVFKNMGFNISVEENAVRVKAEKLIGCDIVTAPYPLFPTDLHPQFASLLCFTKNGGSIKDEVFPTRFAYVNELRKMGANIQQIGNTAFIKPSSLVGAELDATDLRAGAALVIAALGAGGHSKINNVNYIVRGYEYFVEKIANIGGKIKIYKEN